MNHLYNISHKINLRYSERYKKLGYHIRTLGWGTVDQQRYRFVQTLTSGVDFSGKMVVDIGCGFGDYADFLDQADVEYKSYYGLDINPDLIKEAKNRHAGNKNIDFSTYDLLTQQPGTGPCGDIGVMLGLLNLNLSEQMDNYEYSMHMIKNALPLVREALIVDFLSSKRDESYPKEDFVFYHEPSTVLDMALSLSNNISLHHDYIPIPQKEFMLVIWK